MQNITQTEDGYELTIAVNKMFTVCGDGYWSNTAKEVFVESINMFIGNVDVYAEYEDTDDEVCYSDGDLAIVYDEATWNMDELGLIYTDTAFLQCVRKALIEAGVSEAAANDVEYSEQGMQDYGRVSCDAYALADEVRARMQNTVQA